MDGEVAADRRRRCAAAAAGRGASPVAAPVQITSLGPVPPVPDGVAASAEPVPPVVVPLLTGPQQPPPPPPEAGQPPRAEPDTVQALGAAVADELRYGNVDHTLQSGYTRVMQETRELLSGGGVPVQLLWRAFATAARSGRRFADIGRAVRWLMDGLCGGTPYCLHPRFPLAGRRCAAGAPPSSEQLQLMGFTELQADDALQQGLRTFEEVVAFAMYADVSADEDGHSVECFRDAAAAAWRTYRGLPAAPPPPPPQQWLRQQQQQQQQQQPPSVHNTTAAAATPPPPYRRCRAGKKKQLQVARRELKAARTEGDAGRVSAAQSNLAARMVECKIEHGGAGRRSRGGGIGRCRRGVSTQAVRKRRRGFKRNARERLALDAYRRRSRLASSRPPPPPQRSRPSSPSQRSRRQQRRARTGETGRTPQPPPPSQS
eukprot:SAG25_NODE_835_length_5135_cov_3.455719_7_plen_431_part_00